MKTLFLSAFSSLLAVSLAKAADPASGGLDALRQYQSGGDVAPLRHYEQMVAQAVDDPAQRKLLEADLSQVLAGQATSEAKRFACTQLAIIGTANSVPATAALLEQDAHVGIACLALATNPSSEAGQALRQVLGRLNGPALIQVINTVGNRRDPEAVPALQRLTAGDDPAVAGAAYLALGKIGTDPARAALAEGRRRNVPAHADAVAAGSLITAEQLLLAKSLEEARGIYEDLMAPGQAAHVRRGAFEALARLDGDGGLQRAIQALTGPEALFKPSAIAAVATMKNAGASKAFGAELTRLDPAHQALLLEMLAVRADADARRAVEAQLDSPDAVVRGVAIAALGRMGDASAVPLLARAAQAAKEASELKRIELALAELKGGEAVDRALAAQLRNRMAGPKTPFLAALVHRANAVSLPVFLAEAGGTSPDLVKLAFQGLSRVGTADDVPAVLKAVGGLKAEAVRADAIGAVSQLLNRVGTPGGNGAAVRAALQATPGPSGIGTFLPLLAICPDAEGLALVAKAAADPDPAVRDLGLRTLADWPEAAAWEPLSACYATVATETERVLVLRGLTRLLGEQNAHPSPEGVARYRALLGGAKTDNDRKLILGALAGCPHPDALALALDQLAQPGVQAEAKLAVTRIAEAIKAQHPQAADAALKKLDAK